MVTHEPDIAAYARRNVIMRDGRIVSDHPVAKRTNASAEVEKMGREPQEQIIPEIAGNGSPT